MPLKKHYKKIYSQRAYIRSPRKISKDEVRDYAWYLKKEKEKKSTLTLNK